MRDERRKEEISKQGQTNNQGKVTQHTQGSHFTYVLYICIVLYVVLERPSSNVSAVDHEDAARALATLPHSTKWNMVHIQLNLQPQTRPGHHEQRLRHPCTLHGHLRVYVCACVCVFVVWSEA